MLRYLIYATIGILGFLFGIGLGWFMLKDSKIPEIKAKLNFKNKNNN